MQRKLDVCSEESACCDFVFNSCKSVVLQIGSQFEWSCGPLSLCGAPLAYNDKVKGNSLHKLCHPISVAYSIEPNKHQISGGKAYPDCYQVKYLGVIIAGSRYFKHSFEHVKSKFYCFIELTVPQNLSV